MFNLANEKLTEEGFKMIALQIQQLARNERDDMKNLTLNFIALKEQLENEIKERKAQAVELTSLKEMKNQALGLIGIMKEFEEFKLNIIESLNMKKEEKKIIPPVAPVVQMAAVQIPAKEEMKPEIKEIEPEYEVNCLDCGVKRKIEDPEGMPAAEGGKMIKGKCGVCGRRLFKLL